MKGFFLKFIKKVTNKKIQSLSGIVLFILIINPIQSFLYDSDQIDTVSGDIFQAGLNDPDTIGDQITGGTESRAESSRASRVSTSADKWLTFMGGPTHHSNSSSISPADKSLLWSNATEGWVYSSPTINNSRVFFGDEQWYIYSMDIDTGKVIWKHHTGKYASAGGGVSSSLTLNNGRIYFGSDDHYIYAVKESDGEGIWNHYTNGVVSTPTVAAGKVFASSTKAFPKSNGTFYAFNEVDGSVVWTLEKNFSFESVPAVSGGIVYTGCYDNNLYALDVDGFVEGDDGWQGDTNTSLDHADIIWNFTAGGPISGSPAVDNGLVFFGSWDQKVYALDAFTGQKKWEKLLNGVIESSPAVAYGNVYITVNDDGKQNSGGLYVFDQQTGKLKWSAPNEERTKSSPAIAEGRVFFYAGEYINAFDINTEQKVWTEQLSPNLHSSPAIAEGRVFIGASSPGRIMVFGAPDFSLDSADVVISDTEPFAGEFITILLKVKNLGTVDGKGTVTFRYTSVNFSIKEHVKSVKLSISSRNESSIEFQWQVVDNPLPGDQFWRLWFNISDVTPNQANTANDVQSKLLNYHNRDFSDWQMFHGNLERTGYSKEGSKSNRIIWKNLTNTPGPIRGSVLVGNGKVFVSTLNGKIQSFNAITGQNFDEYNAPGNLIGEPSLFIGEDTNSYDSIFVASREGTVYSLDMATGSQHWSYDIGAKVFASPTVYNGLIIVGSEDGYLYALDQDGLTDGDSGVAEGTPQSGQGDLVWRTNLGGAVGYSTGAVSTSQNLFLIGTLSNKFMAVNIIDGSINWSYNTGGQIQSSPAIINDHVIIGSNDSKLYSFDLLGFLNGDGGVAQGGAGADEADLLWTADLGSPPGRSSPAADPITPLVYIGTASGSLNAVSTKTGEVNWTFDAGSAITGSAAVGDNSVFFTTESGQLFALDKYKDDQTGSGKAQWNFTTSNKAKMLSSPAIYGKRVYCADETGMVYALGAHNARPVAVISKPLNNSVFSYEDVIEFDATGSYDVDDTDLTYVWSRQRTIDTESEIFQSTTGLSFKTHFELGGDYIITLTVMDSLGELDTAWVKITVFGKQDDTGPKPWNFHVKRFCELLIPACTLIEFGGAGVVNMAEVVNPGTDVDLKLSVNKFVNFRFANVTNTFLINWTNISIGFSSLDMNFEMNHSRVRMYYWDDGWIKLANSGVIYRDENDITVWANFTELINTKPMIFAPGTFDNTPPDVGMPVDGSYIYPTSGREIDDFVFRVRYRDQDGDSIHSGGWVQVYIGDKIFKMVEENPETANYGTHVLFTVTVPGKDIRRGTYNVSFAAHDGTIRSFEFEDGGSLTITASLPSAVIQGPSRVTINTDFEVDGSLSSDPDGDIEFYYWDFDHTFDNDNDGDFTNDRDMEGEKVTWKYTDIDEFTITLTVVDSTGGEDKASLSVSVIKVSEVAKDGDNASEMLKFLAIAVFILIIVLVIAFLFLYYKKQELRELKRVSGREIPLKKVVVKRIKRRRLGEPLEGAEEREKLPEDEEKEGLESGLVPEDRRLKSGDEEYDEDEFEISEEELDEEIEEDEYDEDDSEESIKGMCQECGETVSTGESVCPSCGNEIKEITGMDDEFDDDEFDIEEE